MWASLRDSDIKHTPALIVFARLDLEHKSSFMDGHSLSWFDPDLVSGQIFCFFSFKKIWLALEMHQHSALRRNFLPLMHQLFKYVDKFQFFFLQSIACSHIKPTAGSFRSEFKRLE